MKVTTTKAFIKAARRLPPDRQKKIASTLSKFMTEPKLPSLDFRSLRGTVGYYVIDSTGGDRIILRKVTDEEFEAVDVGVHDIYRRWNR